MNRFKIYFNLFCLLFPLFLLCFLLFKVSAQNPQDDDVIRTETDLTNVVFTATDKQHRFITSLKQADIRVLEDGVQQELFTFQRETDRPLAVALLVDVSASEERTLPEEKAAARVFIETIMRSNKDEAAVIPFEDYPYLEEPLTSNVIGIYQALQRVEVAIPSYLGTGHPIGGLPSGPGIRAQREGSTSIWDAIALSAGEVLERSRGQRRRAIILLTDGYDTSSRISRSAAIEQALKSETIIYAIGIGDSKYEGVDRSAVTEVAERTGGRAFFPKKNADLTEAFQQIQEELRTQYLIAYSPSNKKRNGAYRQTKIEITNPELAKQQLTLRYRPGYFAKSGQR